MRKAGRASGCNRRTDGKKSVTLTERRGPCGGGMLLTAESSPQMTRAAVSPSSKTLLRVARNLSVQSDSVVFWMAGGVGRG